MIHSAIYDVERATHALDFFVFILQNNPQFGYLCQGLD